ncbi:hypothetical protein H1R20_g8074, partial [Candolleomyces eurysporus]
MDDMLDYVTRVMKAVETAWFIYASASSEDKRALQLYERAMLTSQALERSLLNPNTPSEVRGWVGLRLRVSPWLKAAHVRT